MKQCIAVVDKKIFKNLPFGRSIINVKNGYRFVVITIGEIEVEFQEIEYVDMINTGMDPIITYAQRTSAAMIIAAASINKHFLEGGALLPGFGMPVGMTKPEVLTIEPMIIEDPTFHVKHTGITKEQRSIWRNSDNKKRWKR